MLVWFMFGKRNIFALLIPLICAVVFDANAANRADKPFTYLAVTPLKCVTLSKGRDCYADVNISWSTPTPKNVCLFVDYIDDPIRCWKSQSKAELKFEFIHPQSAYFYLRDSDSNIRLTEKQLSVNWVHERERHKRRWRVF
ncbi:DUF3019 domain-containing protein [Ningiella sp. W23]|uniref:DUF3019 domain-containing protein n=1 Tax=Ningiella sp. W23 TaxID=3023715 RepID=UPI0037562EF2